MLTSAAGAAAGTRRPAPPGPRVRGRAGALVGAAPRSGGAAPTVRRPWPRRRGRAGSTSAAPGAAAGTPTRRSWRPSCPLAPHRTGTTQQVIPEGAGRVNPRVMTRFYPIPGSVQTSAGEGSGSRLDRRSTRAAGLALTPAPIGACLHRAGNDSCEVVSGRVLHRPLWTVWRNRSVRLPVIPSPPTWGGMEWYGRGQAESIRVVDRATGGGSDLQRPRVLAAPEGRSRRSGQATDVSVAQRVVDQGEQLAGGGDLGDVRASAFGQPGPGTPDRTAVETLHRFDGGPADQMVALLGDAATVDGGVGL